MVEDFAGGSIFDSLILGLLVLVDGEVVALFANLLCRNEERLLLASAFGFGFEVVGQRGEYTVFRAKGFIRRLSFLFEDEVLVRQVGSGIEIAGIRRAVARIIYQLHAYISQKRFEGNE